MKKILSLALTLAMVFTLAACGNSGSTESSSPDSEESSTSSEVVSQTEETSAPEDSSVPTEGESQAEASSEPEDEAGSNSLIVYFSWSGNTESVANEIQAQIFLKLSRLNLTRTITILFWILRRRNRPVMPARRSRKPWRILSSTTPSISVFPTGGEICR